MSFSEHCVALKADGSMWTWGFNLYGQLGHGNRTNRSSPIVVVGNFSFSTIAMGRFFSAGLQSNVPWTWGDNPQGQLGNNTAGTGASYSSPILVVGSHSFTKIALAIWHAAALKSDGSIWTWGNGQYGQLGNNTAGTGASRSSPVLVVGNHSFIKVTVGDNHCAALKADGNVWTWGRNDFSMLGTGNNTSRSSPVLVIGNHSFIDISTGFMHNLGLKSDGSVWSWGRNSSGQLGDGTVAGKNSPVLVVGNHSFTQIDCGYNNSFALKADGSVWSWGENGFGQLGNETAVTASVSSPVLVVGNHSFKEITSGIYNGYGLKADGSVWAWGSSFRGQIGNNTGNSYSSPVLVIGNHSFVSFRNYINILPRRIILIS